MDGDATAAHSVGLHSTGLHSLMLTPAKLNGENAASAPLEAVPAAKAGGAAPLGFFEGSQGPLTAALRQSNHLHQRGWCNMQATGTNK